MEKPQSIIVSVVGLGYVGLPVAVAFGYRSLCIGFDINKQRIIELNQCIDRTNEVSTQDLKSTNIRFTNNVEDLKDANFHIIAVPTPIDKARRPDLSPLEKASKLVGQILKQGDIVVYESTVYPGVTEEICIPILEKYSNLKLNIDFYVGYSPERINPGDKTHNFVNINKVVSGSDAYSLEIIAQTYASVIKASVYKASSIKVAEAAKVIENTQRDLNISLMNELAIIFERMEIDTQEVLDAASTKWNFLPFKPGLVGGHCIGVDPYYLTHKAELLGYIPQVILSGRRINDNMGRYVARRAVKQLIKNNHSMNDAHAIILGFTFKENCPDIRNSKVIDIIHELYDYNVKVSVFDPVADFKDAQKEYAIDLYNSWDNIQKADLLIIAVAHDVFKQMQLNDIFVKLNPNAVIFDVKSILPKDAVIEQGYVLCRL